MFDFIRDCLIKMGVIKECEGEVYLTPDFSQVFCERVSIDCEFCGKLDDIYVGGHEETWNEWIKNRGHRGYK